MVELRTGAGTSALDDAAVAGTEAAEAALAELAGEPVALVIVHASCRYDLDALIRGIRRVTGEAPLVGATGLTHFRDGELSHAGQGVSVLAMTAGRYRFGVGAVPVLDGDLLGAGQTLARMAKQDAGPCGSLFSAFLLLAGGPIRDYQELLAGTHRVLGAAVPIVGGIASSELPDYRSAVFCGDRVLADGAVGVWIGSPEPVRVARGHGWTPYGAPLVATDVEGATVRTLGDRDTAEVFRDAARERGGDDTADLISPGPLALPQCGSLRVSLGMLDPDGSYLLRGSYLDEGMVITWTPLPPLATVQVMTCDDNDVLDACDEVVGQVLSPGKAGVLLVFSCVARPLLLGGRAGEEPQRLQVAAGGIRTFGLHTYGEFARIVSPRGFIEASLVMIAL